MLVDKCTLTVPRGEKSLDWKSNTCEQDQGKECKVSRLASCEAITQPHKTCSSQNHSPLFTTKKPTLIQVCFPLQAHLSKALQATSTQNSSGDRPASKGFAPFFRHLAKTNSEVPTLHLCHNLVSDLIHVFSTWALDTSASEPINLYSTMMNSIKWDHCFFSGFKSLMFLWPTALFVILFHSSKGCRCLVTQHQFYSPFLHLKSLFRVPRKQMLFLFFPQNSDIHWASIVYVFNRKSNLQFRKISHTFKERP